MTPSVHTLVTSSKPRLRISSSTTTGWLWAFTLAVLLSVGAGVLGAKGGWLLVAAAIATPVLIAFGLLRPALFLAALLLLRPVLDQFSEDRLNVGFGAINISGVSAVLFLGVALGVLVTAPRITLPGATRVLAAVVAVSALSATWTFLNFGSQVGSLALAELVRLAALLGIYVLAANVAPSPDRVRRLFAIVVLSAMLPAVVAIYSVITGQVTIIPGFNVVRAVGTFSGPNALGQFLALPALILISSPPRTLPRVWRLVALAIVLAAIVLTYSRTGYSILILSVVLVEYRRFPRRVLAVGLVVVGLVLVVPSLRERVLPTSSTATQSASGQASAGYSSFSWRLNNWQGLLGKWEQSPVFGFGLETTETVNPERASQPHTLTSSGFNAHNTFVRALVEGSIVLLTLWVALSVALIRQTGRLTRDPWELALEARVVWAFWVAVIVAGLLSDDPFEATALMYALFALTGSVQGAHQKLLRRTNPNADVRHRRTGQV